VAEGDTAEEAAEAAEAGGDEAGGEAESSGE
jgi:hypothetical protein